MASDCIPILGLHHVTAIAGDPRRNDAFWTRTLGLRRVKKTVNFDDPGTYHLYFGDRLGRPGSLWTTFPHPRARPRQPGTPEVARTTLAIPPGSLARWRRRLADSGIAAEQRDERLLFDDPDGTNLALAEAEVPPEFEGSDDDAPRCIESVELRSLRPDETGRLLVEVFGFARGDRGLYTCGDGAASRRVRVTGGDGGGAPGLGAGAVHHVAFRVAGDAEQLAALDRLHAAGLRPTPVQDRTYFHSIYFREPGGVLFEIATDTPGFTADEPPESLGRALQLPSGVERRRAELEASLAPLDGEDER